MTLDRELRLPTLVFTSIHAAEMVSRTKRPEQGSATVTVAKTARAAATDGAAADGAPRAGVGRVGAEGVVRRRKVSQKVAARRDIRAVREGKKRVWSKAKIRRMIRRIAHEEGGRDYNIQESAMEMLLVHLENWITTRFAWARQLTLLADRVTMCRPELEIAIRMLDANTQDPMHWSPEEFARFDAMMPATVRAARRSARDAAAAGESQED